MKLAIFSLVTVATLTAPVQGHLPVSAMPGCPPELDHWRCPTPAITRRQVTDVIQPKSVDPGPSPTGSIGCSPQGDHWSCADPATSSSRVILTPPTYLSGPPPTTTAVITTTVDPAGAGTGSPSLSPTDPSDPSDPTGTGPVSTGSDPTAVDPPANTTSSATVDDTEATATSSVSGFAAADTAGADPRNSSGKMNAGLAGVMGLAGFMAIYISL